MVIFSRYVPLLSVSLSLACGGKASSAGSPGEDGAAGSPTDAPAVLLDDNFPWFTADGSSRFPSGETDEIIHLAASGSPARGVISTHNHFDLLSDARAIAFSARASSPAQLLVSVSNSIQSYDYFTARNANTPWPVAQVQVQVDWQPFVVPLSNLKPPQTSDADGMPSFFIAFIVEQPQPVEVWLDGVHFVPKSR